MTNEELMEKLITDVTEELRTRVNQIGIDKVVSVTISVDVSNITTTIRYVVDDGNHTVNFVGEK